MVEYHLYVAQLRGPHLIPAGNLPGQNLTQLLQRQVLHRIFGIDNHGDGIDRDFLCLGYPLALLEIADLVFCQLARITALPRTTESMAAFSSI